MKQNVFKAIGKGIANGGHNLLDITKKHSGKIFLAVNLVSTGILVYEVWTRKEKIQKAIEETKDAPLKEKVKVVGKEAAPVILAGAVATGSAIGGTIVAANKIKDLTVKATEAAAVANSAMDAKETYQKAATNVVGEDKEREIKEEAKRLDAEKVRGDVVSKSAYNSGCDIYYDETNPGFDFKFNGDRIERLEDKINRSTCDLGEMVTLDMVYGWIEYMSDDVLDRPSFSDDLGWKSGTKVSVTSEYVCQRDGRGLFKLCYDPQPVMLSNGELSD